MSADIPTTNKPGPSQVSPADHVEQTEQADQIRTAMSVKNLLSPVNQAPTKVDDEPADASQALESSGHMEVDQVAKIDEPMEDLETTNAALTTEPVAAVEPTTPLNPNFEPTTPLNPNIRQEQDLISPLSAHSASDNDDSPTAAPDVPDSEREFICMNDEHSRCMTGQYTLPLSRKVISDHFGRNKGCTLLIKKWPMYCRKHYQRATYNKAQWQFKKLYLIDRQFGIIEQEFPGTTYNIQLKKSEEARLNQFARLLAADMTKEQAAEAIQPKSGKHFEASVPVLVELDHELGKNKTMQQAKHVVKVMQVMLQDKDTDLDQVPSIEFLPQIPGTNTTPKKTPKARATKSPKTPKTPKSTKSSKTPKDKKTPTSHVSAKGSIKKTQKA
ncbi:hypothetical protein IQ07DRAFT_368727 [Pyrenochaeta sp. DS3sAY3a]|nr:hypothetical protein IQ07DRAFT_368727 [Pyrenochaeta sp. DS3sAY3a]